MPNHFKPNSVYVHYPLTIPSENESILKGLGLAEPYNFEKPAYIPTPYNIISYSAAKSILENQKDFHVTWAEGLEVQIGPIGGKFMLAGDKPINTEQRRIMSGALYQTDWRKEVKKFYETTTQRLLEEKTYTVAGSKQVDIVRE